MIKNHPLQRLVLLLVQNQPQNQRLRQKQILRKKNRKTILFEDGFINDSILEIIYLFEIIETIKY